MYLSLDKPESKQVHQFFAMPEAFAAARKDQPMPSRTVFTVVRYAAQLDAQGNPIRGADGQFVKGELLGYAVMEKRTGWGSEYPDSDILIDAVPGVRRLAALADSKVTTSQQLHVLQEAARGRGIDLVVYSARTPEDIIPAMDHAKAAGVAALNVLATPLFATSNRGLVMGRATALRLPAIYQWPEMAEEGGFAAYGPRLTQIYRQEARLVAKIFRGANPADLPVEQPARFELVINLQAAKVIDHEVPAALVLRADKVIE
jgi:hypothetical protein